jgi:hypothetical protein
MVVRLHLVCRKLSAKELAGCESGGCLFWRYGPTGRERFCGTPAKGMFGVTVSRVLRAAASMS